MMPSCSSPVVFFDARRVKICEDAAVRSKAVCLALGVLRDGTRDTLTRGAMALMARAKPKHFPFTQANIAQSQLRCPWETQ